MENSEKFEIVCGKCMVKFSGMDETYVRKSFEAHQQIHNLMTGDYWYTQFADLASGKVWGFANEREQELIMDICTYYDSIARQAGNVG